MSRNIDFWAAVERIRSKDGRFKRQVYPFIMEALDSTIRAIGERRHVSARELVDGVCSYARARYGLLAGDVLENWGIRKASDLGAAVFHLVDAGVLRKQQSDHIEDFAIDYDLRAALEEKYFE